MIAAMNCDLVIVVFGLKYPLDHCMTPRLHTCSIYAVNDVSAVPISWNVQLFADVSICLNQNTFANMLTIFAACSLLRISNGLYSVMVL